VANVVIAPLCFKTMNPIHSAKDATLPLVANRISSNQLSDLLFSCQDAGLLGKHSAAVACESSYLINSSNFLRNPIITLPNEMGLYLRPS